MASNGSPEPAFFTDDERTFFYTEIKIHPGFLIDLRPKSQDHRPEFQEKQVYDEDGQVYDVIGEKIYKNKRLSEAKRKILTLLINKPLSLKEILSNLGYQVLTGNIRTSLSNMLEQDLIIHTIPDKPRSKRQQAAAAQLGRSYAGRVERGEQNISMQSLIQIALTLEVEVGELFPPLRELRAPYRKRLERNQ